MEHLINLNFAPGGLPAVIHVSQYDDTLRQLKFQLWFGRSKVEVPSGAAVRVDIKKPDGHIVLVSGTVDTQDRSIVTVPTTKQMTAAPGEARGMLVVTGSGDKRISSALFVLQVHSDPVEDGDASDSDLSMLQDAIDQTAANASAAQAAATAAQQAASSFTTDTTLSVSGKAADAKKTGDELTAIKADLDDLDDRVEALEEGGSSGSGLTDTVKTALMNLVNHVAWDDDDPSGQSYITALYNALYPPADLVSISAVYTPSGAIYETNELDDLKEDLVVTALMSDQTTRPVTDYTLSGTLTEGTSTITVTYGGKTTTFTVTVSHEAVYARQVTEAGTFIKSGVYASNYDGTPASITEDVYSISDVRAGDVIQLATNWNSSNVVGKESRWISTPSKVAPDITTGTFTKVATSYGLYPVTINQDYETLYIGIINTNSGGYKQYCTWTRESGF